MSNTKTRMSAARQRLIELIHARREGFLRARSEPGEHQCLAFKESGKCSVCDGEARRLFPMPEYRND
jgi:hypothetical protein